MKEAHQYHHYMKRIAVIGSLIVLSCLAGCRQEAGTSLDSATQTLTQFIGDFARQALAAFLL